MSDQFEKIERKLEKELPYAKYINNPEIEKKRPKMEEFKHDPDYEENKRKLERQEKKIEEREGKKTLTLNKAKSVEIEERSKEFEGFLVVEGQKLFGKDTQIIPTSRFDDVMNGVDLVLEIKFQGKIIRLGIDASIISDYQTPAVDYKYKRIRKRIKEKQIHLRYFKSILDTDVKGKLENLPRAVAAISEGQWQLFLREVGEAKKEAKEESLPFQVYFLSLFRYQLENQFLFTLFLNADEMQIRYQETRLRPKKRYQKIANEFYNQAIKIANGKWEKISELLTLFEREENVLKQKSITAPERFAFLKNIVDILKWLSSKEKENNIRMVEAFGGEAKEKTALLMKAVVSQELAKHWETEDFPELPQER